MATPKIRHDFSALVDEAKVRRLLAEQNTGLLMEVVLRAHQKGDVFPVELVGDMVLLFLNKSWSTVPVRLLLEQYGVDLPGQQVVEIAEFLLGEGELDLLQPLLNHALLPQRYIDQIQAVPQNASFHAPKAP